MRVSHKWLYALPVAGLILVVAVAKADNTIGDLQDQRTDLEQRINATKEEYQSVAQQKAEAQESCNLVAEREKQLKQFTTLNESRRAEVKLIDQKLDRLTRPRQ